MKKNHLKRKIKMFLFSLLICLFAVFFVFLLKNIKLYIEKSKSNANKIENLQNEMKTLEEEIKSATNVRITDDMSDDDYEEIARDDLGLAKRNEIILIPK